MNFDEIISQLNEKQLERVRACNSYEEVVALAKTAGIDEAVRQSNAWLESAGL